MSSSRFASAGSLPYVKRPRVAFGSSESTRESSTNVYVPYPRLCGFTTSAHRQAATFERGILGRPVRIDHATGGAPADTRTMLKRFERKCSGRPGSWPARGGGLRVLVENPNRAVRSAYADMLREAGYDVATCGGPAGAQVHCPLVEGKRCRLVEQADVVVSTSDLAESREILAALASRGGVSVVFEVPEPLLGSYCDVAGDATLVPSPVTEESLRAAVRGTPAWA